MKRLARIALASASLWCTAFPARAQVPIGTFLVFVTVDAVRTEAGARIWVTGILEGTSTPVEQFMTVTASQVTSCEKMALLAMSRPGQVKFEMGYWPRTPSNGACQLTKVAP